MSGKPDKTQRPPADQPWVWQTRELRASAAWRSAGINARRFVDFLLLEHMNSAGKRNGLLKAPRRQLEDFGIGSHHVTAAICEAEQLGLVHARRGGMRVATTYGLTWLPSHDGTPASDRWRFYRNPDLKPLPMPKSKNLTAKQQSGLAAKQQSDAPNLTVKQQSHRPEILTAKQQHLYRKPSYQGGEANYDLSVGRQRATNVT